MTTEMIIEQELRDEVETLRALNVQLQGEVEKLRERNGKLSWKLMQIETAVMVVSNYNMLPKELLELCEVQQRAEGSDGVDPIRSAL